MKVIKPVSISGSQLVSSNATETHSDWLSTIDYSVGDVVIYGTRLYIALASSTSTYPKQPDINPSIWYNSRPTNKWAMFDNQVSTKTTHPSSLVVEVMPRKNTNSVALLGISGSSLLIEAWDYSGGSLIYSKTVDLNLTPIDDWYSYFFEDHVYKTDVVVTDIPPYIDAVIRVSLSSESPVSIGNMVVGNIFSIGGSQYGLNFGIRDYSLKTTDDFGTTTFVVRNYSKRMDANVFVDNKRLSAVSSTLSALRAVPTVWVASDSDIYSNDTTVYGYYKDWNTEISYPSSSLIRIEIEGLT